MSSKLLYFAVFTAGVVTGAAVVRNYIRRQTDEEIRSVREAFSAKYSDMRDKEKKDAPYIIAPTDDEEIKLISEVFPAKCSDTINTESKNAPYIITPTEFGEEDDYETITLYYHSDDVLTDHDNEIIDDIENSVGSAALNTLRESGEDSIFVRNPERKCDYEILIDLTAYSEE